MKQSLKNRHYSEEDVIALQRESVNNIFYLVKKGYFFYAYNEGAHALSQIMHYPIKREIRANGLEILVADFPADQLAVVLEHIEEQGGQVMLVSDDWVQIKQ
jgi:hypothetical protein